MALALHIYLSEYLFDLTSVYWFGQKFNTCTPGEVYNG